MTLTKKNWPCKIRHNEHGEIRRVFVFPSDGYFHKPYGFERSCGTSCRNCDLLFKFGEFESGTLLSHCFCVGLTHQRNRTTGIQGKGEGNPCGRNFGPQNIFLSKIKVRNTFSQYCRKGGDSGEPKNLAFEKRGAWKMMNKHCHFLVSPCENSVLTLTL